MSRYVATVNTPGYLPMCACQCTSPGYLPMDDDPPVFDTAREAWEYLREELGAGMNDDAWQPDDPNDPEGPHSLTPLALALEAWAEGRGHVQETGTVYGDTPGYAGSHDLGLTYSVDYAEEDA